MADVSRTVETIFKVTGTAAVTSAMGSVASSAEATGSSLMGMLGGVRTLALVGVGAMTGLGAQMIHMQSAAEGTQQSIAGALSAFGAAGSFQEGLEQSRGVMEIINREAAALPGSAEDYVQVFRTALPAAMASGFQNIEQIAHFTNQMTAIASANQESSMEAGMDMSRMLQGRAGAEVKLWRTISPLIGKTAEQFNHMSAPARAQAMQGAIHRYADTLSHMGDTWDAISGTTSQYLIQMARAASMPLFEAAKTQLKGVNEWLERNNDAIVHTGQLIARHMVDGVEAVRARVTALIPLFQRIGGAVGGVGAWAGAHMGTVARAVGGAALGPAGSMLAGGAMSLAASHPAEIAAAGDALLGMFHRMAGMLEPLVAMGDALSNGIGGMMAGALPGVVSGFTALGDHLTGFVSTVAPALTDVFNTLSATVGGPFGTAIGSVVSLLSGALGDALSTAGDSIKELAHQFNNAILTLESWTERASSSISRFGTWANNLLGGGHENDFSNAVHMAFGNPMQDMIAMQERSDLTVVNSMMAALHSMGLPTAGTGAVAGPAAQMQESLDSISNSLGGAGGNPWDRAAANHARATRRLHGANAPGARGGAHTVNDFRHSRFEIMQKFAEGYDPDRIAIAFTHDLERTADRRLSGQFEPAHAVR